MGGYEWTEAERAFVVYYAFLGVRRDDITELLNRRGFARSGKAVSSMITSIQKNEEVAITSLSRTEADALIDRLASGCEICCSLLPVDGDQEIVDRVSARIRGKTYHGLIGSSLDRESMFGQNILLG